MPVVDSVAQLGRLLRVGDAKPIADFVERRLFVHSPYDRAHLLGRMVLTYNWILRLREPVGPQAAADAVYCSTIGSLYVWPDDRTRHWIAQCVSLVTYGYLPLETAADDSIVFENGNDHRVVVTPDGALRTL